MFHLRGSSWGPFSLPEFLREQLEEHGFSPDDAGRCARRIGEQAPGSETAASTFVDLGSCKFLEADIDGAIAAWRHAITSGHDTAAARSLLNLGLLHEHLHLHERALGLLGRATELDVSPYVVPAAMASARCQVAIGDADLAMETMARLAQRVMASGSEGAELSEALYGLGDVAEHAGRPDRAERAWRVAMAGGVADIQQASMERLARLLLADGHDHAAFEVLATNTFAVDDADPVFLDAAELFLQRGEAGLAAEVLAIVHGAHCTPSDRFRLADAKMSCGQVNEAIDELEALLADPDAQVQVRALFSLGQVYASHEMVDPAVSMFERVVSAADDYWSGAAQLALGDVIITTGDVEAATSHWTHAASTGVSGVASQARARLEDQAAATPDQDQAIVLAATAPELVVVEPVVLADAQLISLDELADVDGRIGAHEASEISPISLASEPVVADQDVLAEPQLISLEVVDADEATADGDVSEIDEPVLVGLEAADQSGQSDALMGNDRYVDLTESATADVDHALIGSSSGQSAATSPSITRPATAAFASHLDEPNPYAALAPDHDSNDVKPTTRNPYAELAPNFDDAEPPPDVEPGDWESMLEDWPRDKPAETPKKLPSAFSRYT